MPIFRKGGVSVLFVHVPKTAGSSIENLFRDSGWQVDLLDRNGPKTLNQHRRCSPQHMHADALSRRLRLETFQMIFMVVREPLARFRSEIVMRNPKLSAPWHRSVDRYTADTLGAYTGDPYIFDNHIRPQSEFYVPGSTVFRFEDGMDGIAETLRDVHGLRLNLRKGVPHLVSRDGAISGSAVQIPERWQSELVQFYREDYLRFGYDLPRSTAA